MKATLIPILFLMFLVSACGSDKQEQQQEPAKQEMQQDAQKASFYCPMKCEGEKTYAEAGTCPTCGMDLVAVDTDADTEMDSHEGHNH
jgi:Cu2+-exporting ATPase